MREWHKHDRSAQVYSNGMLFYVYDLHIQVKEYNVVCRGDTYMTWHTHDQVHKNIRTLNKHVGMVKTQSQHPLYSSNVLLCVIVWCVAIFVQLAEVDRDVGL